MKNLVLLFFKLFFFIYSTSGQNASLTITVRDSISKETRENIKIRIIPVEKTNCNVLYCEDYTDNDGTYPLNENSCSCVSAGNDLEIVVLNLPKKYKYYKIPDSKKIRLSKHGDTHNIYLIPPNKFIQINGKITNSSGSPLANINVFIDSITSSKSDILGNYQMIIPINEINAKSENGKIKIQYDGGKDFIKDSVIIQIGPNGVIPLNKVIRAQPKNDEPIKQTFTFRSNITGPEKYDNNKVSVEVFQNKSKIDQFYTNLNQYFQFDLSDNYKLSENFEIRVSCSDLDTASRILSVANLSTVIDIALSKPTRLSKIAIYIRGGAQPGWSNDKQLGGGLMYKINDRSSIGLDVTHFHITDVELKYTVFESNTLTIDTFVNSLEFGFNYNNTLYSWNKNNNIYCGVRAGIGKYMTYVSAEIGYRYFVSEKLSFEVNPEILICNVRTKNLEFNYYGNAQLNDESIVEKRVNLCAKIFYRLSKK